jgi:hypothetical protein
MRPVRYRTLRWLSSNTILLAKSEISPNRCSTPAQQAGLQIRESPKNDFASSIKHDEAPIPLTPVRSETARVQCTASGRREEPYRLVLEANDVGWSVPTSGPCGGRSSLPGTGASDRRAANAGATRARRSQRRRPRQVRTPRPSRPGGLVWSPGPRRRAIGQGSRSPRSSVGGCSQPRFRQPRPLASTVCLHGKVFLSGSSVEPAVPA